MSKLFKIIVMIGKFMRQVGDATGLWQQAPVPYAANMATSYGRTPSGPVRVWDVRKTLVKVLAKVLWIAGAAALGAALTSLADPAFYAEFPDLPGAVQAALIFVALFIQDYLRHRK